MIVTRSVTTGLIIGCLGGAALLAADQMTGAPVWMRPAALAVCCIGTLIFLSGFMGLASMFREPSGVHRDDAAAAAMALIRAMIAVSIADGHVDDKEISLILKIYKQLTGSNIPEETIRETAEHMIAEKVSITDEMDHLRPVLDDPLKYKIIKASLYILAADGKVESAEESILQQIQQGLKVPNGKFEKIKKEFLESKGLTAS